VLSVGGYAIGATRHDGASGRSTTCEQAKQEFKTPVGQIRKQLRRDTQATETDSRQITIETTRVEILSAVVGQNPTCFDVETRAIVAVLQQHPAEGQADAALCDLTGIQPDYCSITVD